LARATATCIDSRARDEHVANGDVHKGP
jgi:hypothetical protein